MPLDTTKEVDVLRPKSVTAEFRLVCRHSRNRTAECLSVRPSVRLSVCLMIGLVSDGLVAMMRENLRDRIPTVLERGGIARRFQEVADGIPRESLVRPASSSAVSGGEARDFH